MAVPEAQLDTWSTQGAVAQSRDTYATIKGALEDPSATYKDKSYSTFLQGSYGNDTNIYADSDVDVVILLDSVYYNDLRELSDADKLAYNAARFDADYTLDNFKAAVIAQLTKKFPGKVTPGNKAIYVEGDGKRRDVDVLPAAEFRRYFGFTSWSNQNYVEGICFWNSSGEQIVNYPKQHSDNCTTKHQNTGGWFKPTVRVLKNMRNRMVESGYLEADVAPSYFLEGMLYNVPNTKFGKTFDNTVVNALNWLISLEDRSKLVCANEQFYLINPTALETWRADKLQTYLNAAAKFWDEF